MGAEPLLKAFRTRSDVLSRCGSSSKGICDADRERLRTVFVTDFPVNRLIDLTLDQYVIGNGPEKRSFCYRLQHELEPLGRITAGSHRKFGVYMSHGELRFAKKWGKDPQTAFQKVKEAIVSLLALPDDDLDALQANPLSPLVKGKLLFVYKPKHFLCVYSEAHLRHFLRELNLRTGHAKPGSLMMAKVLLDYRDSIPELKAASVYAFADALYDAFGKPAEKGSQDAAIPDEAIRGASFLETIPLSGSPSSGNGSGGSGKTDFEARDQRNRQTGERGEDIVCHLERQRLRNAGFDDLAQRVECVSRKNDSLGYDVLSFETDGAPRHIEVKSTRGAFFDDGFFLTANELEKARTLNNFYVYLVVRVFSKNPGVYPMVANGVLDSDQWMMIPETYRVRPVLAR